MQEETAPIAAAQSAALATIEENTAAVELPTVTIEDLIKAETSRFSLTPKQVKELDKKFSGLTINGIEDKAGYKKVTEALGIIRPVRTAIAKEKKAIKERYAMVGKALDAREKELEALIRKVEDPLQAEKDRIDAMMKEQEEREAREKAERERQRIKEVIDHGCVFDGEYYAIGQGVSISAADIPGISAELWEVFMSKVREERDRLLLEAEEKRKQEEQEKEAQRKEQERLDNERAELERQKQELADNKRKSRETVLKASGYYFSEDAGAWIKRLPVEGSPKAAIASFEKWEAENFEDDKFYGKIESDIVYLEARKADIIRDVEKEKEAKEQEARKAARIAQVNDMGLTAYNFAGKFWYKEFGPNMSRVTLEELTAKDAEAWDVVIVNLGAEMDHFAMAQQEAEERRRQDNQRKEDERRENARKELPEVEQILLYLGELVGVKVPVISGYMAPHFEEFKAMLKSAIERMTDKTKIVTNAAGQEGEGRTK